MLFTLNTLLVLMIFKFLFWISVMSKNDLIRKIRLISKFMTPQSGKQIVAKHILTNISRRKGNQAMIFGQFIERNMRIFFLKIHTQNAIEILFPYPFLKKQNWAYLWINILKFHTACFMVRQVEEYQSILKPSCRPFAFTSQRKVWN